MCARPPFEVIAVTPARQAKTASPALSMEGFESQTQGNLDPSPVSRVNRYAPYRAQSVRKDERSSDIFGLRSVQSDPVAFTQSPETSGASMATAIGPEAKPDRASSMAPGSCLTPETSAQVPSSCASSGGCSSSQARGAAGNGSGCNGSRTGGGCSRARGGVSACPDAAAALPEAAGNCTRCDGCCGGGSSESKSCQGAGPRSHGCTRVSEQGSTGSGAGQSEHGLSLGMQGLRGLTAGLSRGAVAAAAAAAAGGPQRVRPSIARVVRRVVKRKAMEEDTLPSTTSPLRAVDKDAAAPATVKPTFGDLEDLWRKDSEARSYCSSVCSAPAMCRSGQEGVAGPTPEIPGMIVAESSRRKRMRTAAQDNHMALLV